MQCTRRRRERRTGEEQRAGTPGRRPDVSPCECKTRDANHSTVDSLVFGRNHHRVMPSNGLLWKKNFT
jgi:hypothetical protein